MSKFAGSDGIGVNFKRPYTDNGVIYVTQDETLARRPIRTRDTTWARATASRLGRWGVRPNQISLLSIFFGAISGGCFCAVSVSSNPVSKCVCFAVAALCIQFRLLCNLFDGMVAVEGGFKTKSGELFNELPDRFADGFIFVGAGYSFSDPHWLVECGWLAALLSIIAAYVRTLGAAMGAGHQFLGPMAKQHRMATMTVTSVVNASVIFLTPTPAIMLVGLGLVILGCVITIVRRCRAIIRCLEAT